MARLKPPSSEGPRRARTRSCHSLGFEAVGLLGLRVAGALVAFLSTILVARLFGAEWAGRFFLASALITASAVLSQLGMDLPLLRFVSVASARDDVPLARGLLGKAAMLSLGAGSILAGAIVIGAARIGAAFDDAALPGILRVMALSIVPYAIVLLQGRAFMALGRPAVAELSHRLGFQAIFIALLLLLAEQAGGLSLGVAFSTAYWSILLVNLWLWRRSTASSRESVPVASATLLRPGVPILLAAGVQLVVDWSDTVLLGYFMPSRSVGIYGTAIRLSMLMTLVLGAAAAVFGPRFAELHESGSTAPLASLAARVARGSSLAALPLLLAFLLVPHRLMALFGTEFVSGARALSILGAGQFLNVAAGLVGLILAMTGHEKRVLQATGAAALLNVGLNLTLIPRWGIEGAALATAASLLAFNALSAGFVRKELGINIYFPRKVDASRASSAN